MICSTLDMFILEVIQGWVFDRGKDGCTKDVSKSLVTFYDTESKTSGERK